MGIFRRDKDSRRVAQFPDKETALETLKLITSSASSRTWTGGGKPALTASEKPSRKERKANAAQRKQIQTDATRLAEEHPAKYDTYHNAPDKDIWREPKGNLEAHRDAEAFPEKDNPNMYKGKKAKMDADIAAMKPAPIDDPWK